MKNVGLNKIPSVKGYALNLTMNLVFVAVFYVFVGAAVSYGLSKVFPAYDEKWKKGSLVYQTLDVAAEMSIITIVAFWLTYFVNSTIPVLHISSALEHYVESFGGQAVFLYAVFIFMETLDDKLIWLFREIFREVK
jgi:hypothetical protein